MVRSSYRVYYRVNNTDTARVLQLEGPSESQAISELKRQGAIPFGATVVIRKIERV